MRLRIHNISNIEADGLQQQISHQVPFLSAKNMNLRLQQAKIQKLDSTWSFSISNCPVSAFLNSNVWLEHKLKLFDLYPYIYIFLHYTAA